MRKVHRVGCLKNNLTNGVGASTKLTQLFRQPRTKSTMFQNNILIKKAQYWILFLLAVLLFSCQKSSELSASREPARVMVTRIDGEILRIAEDARNTLPSFFRNLTRGADSDYFCVKYPFMADEDSGVDMEQIWLTDIHFKNGIHYGVFANNPRHLSGLKKGDKVIFDMDTVTDWMYVRGGKIIGGDSIKYLLEQIPENQRSNGERELLRMFY